MEIEVLGVDGVPPETIVSIRAGASRRQAPVSALSGGVPFRFPTGPKGLNPFKVDLFAPLCSARLALKPEAGIYECPIDGNGVKVKFTVNEPGKDPSSAQPKNMEAVSVGAPPPATWPALLPNEDDPNFPNTAAAVKDYLDDHHLLKFVKALLQTVVREQPRDPFQFIADQFRTAATAAKTGGDVTAQLGSGGPLVGGATTGEQRPREVPSVERLRTNSLLETPDETAVRNVATDVFSEVAIAAALSSSLARDKAPALKQDVPRSLPEAVSSGAMKVEVQCAMPNVEAQTRSAPEPVRQPLPNMLGEPQRPASGGAQKGGDMAVIMEEAREALLTVLTLGEQHHESAVRGEAASGAELESAKAEAIQALLSVMDVKEGGNTADAQRQAVDTMAAVLEEGDSRPGSAPMAGDELDAAKAGAIEALLAVIKSDPDGESQRSSVDFSGILFGGAMMEDAQAKAVEQLVDAIGDLHEEEEKKAAGQVLSEEDEEIAKMKYSAIDALSAAFTLTPSPEPQEDEMQENVGNSAPEEEEEPGLQAAKHRARDALVSVLSGPIAAQPIHSPYTPQDATEEFDEAAVQVKASARAALDAALFAEMEAPVEPDEEDIRSKAQSALDAALLFEASETPEDVTEQEMMDAKDEARTALAAAFFAESPPATAQPSNEAAELVKASARDALDAALLAEAELLAHPDEEELRMKAQSALDAALLFEASEMHIDLTEEEMLDVKEGARAALDAALLAEDHLAVTEEDLDNIKEKTRHALHLALLHEIEGEEGEDLSAIKEKTKQALRSSMLGGASSGSIGVDALRASTPGQASDVGGVSAASVEIPPIPTGIGHRKQSFRESSDPPRAAAEEAKASLLAAKAELMQLNAELRSEVTELSEVFEGLVKERELLKQQLTQA